VPRKKLHPDFHKYTDIENFKHYPNLFAEGEQIICSEKIHGSNFRCALLPSYAGSLWKKILKFFHLLPKYEFVFGSHNVQMQNKLFTGDTPTNIYAEMVRKYALEAILKPGEAVYGEIYGGGIQKNYTYGCGENEHKLAIFDVMIDGKYLDQIAAQNWCKARDLPFVRILYIGPFKREVVNDLCKGDSKFEPSQKVIEGVVIKPLQETTCHVGRKVLKFINDEYLLGDQSDYH
jgi:RNA ligase (TIGR02306 family)